MPLRICERAHCPERRRLHALRIRRHVDDEVRRRDAERADRRARKHELYRRDAAVHPCEHEHGECGEDCADEGAARHAEGNRRRADEDRKRRTDGRAGGNTEDERLGEWILHARLHDDTRKRESRTCRHRKQNTRHTQ